MKVSEKFKDAINCALDADLNLAATQRSVDSGYGGNGGTDSISLLLESARLSLKVARELMAREFACHHAQEKDSFDSRHSTYCNSIQANK